MSSNIARPNHEPETFYVHRTVFDRQKAFTPEDFCTKSPFYQEAVYTTNTFTPKTKAFTPHVFADVFTLAYQKQKPLLLHQKYLALKTPHNKPLYTKAFLSHQTPFIRHCLSDFIHTRRLLQQTPSAPPATSSSTAEWSKRLLHHKPYNARRNRKMAHTSQPWRKHTDPKPTVRWKGQQWHTAPTQPCDAKHIKNKLILHMSMQNAWNVHSGVQTIGPKRISCKTSVILIEAGQFKSSAGATRNNIPMSRILPCNEKQHSGVTKYCAFMKNETPPWPFFFSDSSFLWLSSCDFVCDSFFLLQVTFPFKLSRS